MLYASNRDLSDVLGQRHKNVKEVLSSQDLTAEIGAGYLNFVSGKVSTYDYLETYGDGWQPWIRFGFAVLDLEDDGMHITYVDEFDVDPRQLPSGVCSDH